jgi:hypothetical protein
MLNAPAEPHHWPDHDMPRKTKSTRAKPESARRPAAASKAANKYGAWRRAVEDLLAAEWQHSDDVKSVAATVVGMFDAGATDAEVTAFLRAQELESEEPPLTDDARLTLVRQLHRGAGAE